MLFRVTIIQFNTTIPFFSQEFLLTIRFDYAYCLGVLFLDATHRVVFSSSSVTKFLLNLVHTKILVVIT